MNRTILRMTVPLAIAVGLLAACSKQESSQISRIEEKTFTITPRTVEVRVGALAGQLTGLAITQRVNAETGEVVYGPQLSGTLELKNTSPNQSVRLIGGAVNYLDALGKPIPLAEGRTDTRLQFSSYSSERLDPGMVATHRVDVPFPALAVKESNLADLKLDLSYIPTPYHAESITLAVTLAKPG